MKELDVFVFIAVFQEMLGVLFWPLVAIAVLGAAGFLFLLVRDRGVSARRFLAAEIIGLFGGFAAVWFMLAVTASRLQDIGGPIDWVLTLLIWLAGAIGTTVLVYIALALFGGARPASARQKAPEVSTAQKLA